MCLGLAFSGPELVEVILRPGYSGESDEARTPRQVCFSPDGRHLALVSMDGEVVVYACPVFRTMWSSNQCYGSSVWFSADGRRLHGTDGCSWDVETGVETPGGVLDVDRSARGTWAWRCGMPSRSDRSRTAR